MVDNIRGVKPKPAAPGAASATKYVPHTFIPRSFAEATAGLARTHTHPSQVILHILTLGSEACLFYLDAPASQRLLEKFDTLVWVSDAVKMTESLLCAAEKQGINALAAYKGTGIFTEKNENGIRGRLVSLAVLALLYSCGQISLETLNAQLKEETESAVITNFLRRML